VSTHRIASVAGLVLALERGVPLRAALSDTLGDPSLEIAYWLAQREEWVDADGRTRTEPVAQDGQSVTMVESQGERIAALLHDARLDEQPDLVDAVAAAAAMTLQTERLQAELRAQYEFLIAVVNTAPSLLVILDTEGRIRNQNKAVLDASGYADEELVRGRTFWEVFIDPDERDAARRRFIDAAPGFTAGEYENTFTNVRGEKRVIAWRHAPVEDATGRVVSIIAGGIDITERQQHEEAVRAERDFLITITRATPSLLAVLDADGRVNDELGVNRAFAKVIGFADDSAMGRFFWELVARPDETEALRRAVLAAVESDVLVEHESTWLTRAGRQLAVTWTCRRLGDASDRPLFLVCATDVTEHRFREQLLQRERDITATLMQAIPSLVVVVDSQAVIVDSGVDETTAGVNDAFRAALGWRDEQLVHRSVLDLIDDEDGSYLALMAIASAANGVVSTERESQWLRADGEQIDVAWTATPVADVTGRKDSLVLITGMDVTERKRQEEEIRASRSRIVRAADDARRKLERNLHDGAQQRLVALSVSLRLAEAKLADDPVVAAGILAGAREELALALEELRELARGIHPAVLTDRGLAAAVEALVTRTPLPVEVDVPEEPLPPEVEAALYYVVSESLTNVVKYAGATSARVRVGLTEDGAVAAEVSDDGHGGADPSRGTGLRGLADRVAALDGSLVVESPAPGGTRILVEIPLPAEARELPEAAGAQN
jgi:PAS domain S-box-containing protein